MTAAVAPQPHSFLNNPHGYLVVRPNTPVLPFAAPLATATFIDPSAHVIHGDHIEIGTKTYVAPYATLDASTGYIKIGSGSEVLDNAIIQSNPNHNRVAPPSVLIGDSASIGYHATINGPSVIGAYGKSAKPTGIGANALIDGATIGPGSVVGPLAYVGPGVTVPSGVYVLPGVSVTNDAEASNPALGKVIALPAKILADLTTALTRGSQLASGYTALYEGNAATGINTGVDPAVSPGVFNGNLAAVSGTSQQPGPTSATSPTGITFEPSKSGPKFPGPHTPQVEADLYNFRARVTGDVRFGSRVKVAGHKFGRSNSVRGDQGQPIAFYSSPNTGKGVTITSPLGGSSTSGTTTTTVGGIAIGTGFQAGNGAVVLGGPTISYAIGQDVSIGQNAVVDRSILYSGATIGARSYISNSLIAPNTVIPAGTIMINNVVVRTIQW